MNDDDEILPLTTRPLGEQTAAPDTAEDDEIYPLSPEERKGDAAAARSMSRGKSLVGGIVGAPIGAAIGAPIGLFRMSSPWLRALAQDVHAAARAHEAAIAQQAAEAGTPAHLRSAVPGTPLPPAQGPRALNPVGGSGTMNYALKFGGRENPVVAATALDMSKRPGGAWDVIARDQAMRAKIAQMWGPGLDKPDPRRAFLIVPENPPRVRVSPGVAGSAAPTRPLPAPQRTLGERFAQARNFLGRHPVITGLVGGALGGFGAGYGAMEAAERYQEGDVPGAALSGTGALASLAALYPPAVIPASVAGLAALIGTEVLDQLRREGPERRAVGPEEEEAARYAAFGLYPDRQMMARRRVAPLAQFNE